LTPPDALGQSAAMTVRNAFYVVAILFATAAISADNGGTGSISGTINGVEVGKQNQQDEAAQIPPKTTCVSSCQAAESRCSREVRSARRDCERVAANGGRDVFTGRYDGYGIDYGQFCNYFAHPDVACGSGYYSRGCQSRLAVRHGICLDAMQNIASLRYDCFRTERDANIQCRAELSDCKAACQ
jgi:hypothetical protein